MSSSMEYFDFYYLVIAETVILSYCTATAVATGLCQFCVEGSGCLSNIKRVGSFFYF